MGSQEPKGDGPQVVKDLSVTLSLMEVTRGCRREEKGRAELEAAVYVACLRHFAVKQKRRVCS